MDYSFERHQNCPYFFQNSWLMSENKYICERNKENEIKNIDFSQALAGLVCELWEDLTDTQKEEIRKVLR